MDAAGLSQHWSGGAGGIAPPGAVPDPAAGLEPSAGGRGRGCAAADGEHLAAALPGTGRGRRAGRAAGVAAAGQGAARGGGGDQGPGLDPRPDAGPAEAAVRLVDQPGGARPDRGSVRQDARPVDGAALFAALEHDPAKAPGPGQGAPAGSDRGLAGAALPGDRQARQGRGRCDLLGRRDGHLQSGPDRPQLRARKGRRRWSPVPPSGSRRA